MKFDIVCFDCDSTLSRIEGIDELAKAAGLGEEMAALTHAAMNGELPLEAVYAKRLEAIRPEQKAIEKLADLYIEEVTLDAKQTLQELMQAGAEVHIISGGLRQAIYPLADFMGVPRDRVHAVDIFFGEDGRYQGFDEASDLAKSGGKARTCARLNNQDKRLVMIGDGQTDLEAQQAGATVIGFGGIIARAAVAQRADFFTSEPSLSSVLEFIL